MIGLCAVSGSVYAYMHMHPANQHPTHNPRQIAAQIVIAVLVDVVLVFPAGKRVAGRRNWGQSEVFRVLRDAGAQAFQVIARFRHIGANAGADLDLALQIFGADLAFEFLRGRPPSFHLGLRAGQGCRDRPEGILPRSRSRMWGLFGPWPVLLFWCRAGPLWQGEWQMNKRAGAPKRKTPRPVTGAFRVNRVGFSPWL